MDLVPFCARVPALWDQRGEVHVQSTGLGHLMTWVTVVALKYTHRVTLGKLRDLFMSSCTFEKHI